MKITSLFLSLIFLLGMSVYVSAQRPANQIGFNNLTRDESRVMIFTETLNKYTMNRGV